MKKRVLVISILIISFSIFINIGNRSLTCNELLYKKLWINETYNYSICIPVNWASLGPHTGHLTSLYDESETIGIEISNGSFLSLLYIYSRKSEIGKYDKKSNFGNKEIIDSYFINNDGKKEFGDFNYVLEIGKKKYYRFGFNEKTDEMKAIINSIKVLKEF